MCLSFVRRTRARSVSEVLEEDCRFTLCRLSEGDDVYAVPGLGVDDGHGDALEQAQCHEAVFFVTEAAMALAVFVARKVKRRIIKDGR